MVINNTAKYDEIWDSVYSNSGFRYKERSDDDTVEGTLHMIEEHFGLV